MALDELLAGLAVFKEGMTTYATSRAVNDANEQVQQLNLMEKDREAVLQGQMQIGNDLAMRMTAAGADPGKIQAAVGQLAPSMGAIFQAEQNKDLQASSQKHAESMFEKDAKLRKELAGMEIQKAEAKMKEARRKELGNFTMGYQKELNDLITKDFESHSAAQTALKAIKQNKPIGVQFAQMALAKTQTGAQMTDAEREVFSGSQAKLAKIRQAAQQAISGDLTPENKAYLANVAKLLADATQNRISAKVKHVSGQAYKRAKAGGYDFSPEEIEEMMNPTGMGAAAQKQIEDEKPAPTGRSGGSLGKYVE